MFIDNKIRVEMDAGDRDPSNADELSYAVYSLMHAGSLEFKREIRGVLSVYVTRMGVSAQTIADVIGATTLASEAVMLDENLPQSHVQNLESVAYREFTYFYDHVIYPFVKGERDGSRRV